MTVRALHAPERPLGPTTFALSADRARWSLFPVESGTRLTVSGLSVSAVPGPEAGEVVVVTGESDPRIDGASGGGRLTVRDRAPYVATGQGATVAYTLALDAPGDLTMPGGRTATLSWRVTVGRWGDGRIVEDAVLEVETSLEQAVATSAAGAVAAVSSPSVVGRLPDGVPSRA